jgi:hypothetical protein
LLDLELTLGDTASTKLKRLLADRTEPLLVDIDEDGCIVAAHYEYGSQFYLGVVFRHSEGPIDLGVNPPSRREYYEDQIVGFSNMSSTAKRESLVKDGWKEEDDLPEDNEAFSNWLNESIDDYLIESWADTEGELSEGTPGFLILDSLTESEASAHKLRRVDLGGPASTAPRVKFTGSRAELQSLLEKKRLPLRLVFGTT